MPIEFKKVREITVAGFAADPDPNVTPPTEANTFNVPGEVTGQTGDDMVRGHVVKFTYVDAGGAYVAGGTCDFTTWYQDSSILTRWIALNPEAAALANRGFVSSVIAKLFVQVTALAAPGGGTKIQVWIAPRTSTP